MKVGGGLSIWFFTGISLAVNGLVIFATGIYELAHPPEVRVVLYDLHANVWWGGLMLILGAVFCLRHSPAKERARLQGKS